MPFNTYNRTTASARMLVCIATSAMALSSGVSAAVSMPQAAQDNSDTAINEQTLLRTLPDKLFDGYWAATKMIGGMGVVLKYEPSGVVILHEYDCNRPYHPNVSVKSDYDTRMRLIPTDDDNVINVYSYSRQRINSQIQNIQIIGNMLDLEQVFVRSRSKLTVPYTYKHSETLTPICNHDKRKK